eukprot:68826-Amphidinium_carterae.2
MQQVQQVAARHCGTSSLCYSDCGTDIGANFIESAAHLCDAISKDPQATTIEYSAHLPLRLRDVEGA